MASGRAQAAGADPYPGTTAHPHGGPHKLMQAMLEPEAGTACAHLPSVVGTLKP